MKINLKYTVALNILLVCELYKKEKITANYINKITGCDVTTIRQVMYDIKKAGFIDSKPGPGGTKLAKDLSEISLFDVYASVLDPSESMMKFYEGSSDNIQTVVETQFNEYRDMLFTEMQKTTVKALCDKIKTK